MSDLAGVRRALPKAAKIKSGSDVVYANVLRRGSSYMYIFGDQEEESVICCSCVVTWCSEVLGRGSVVDEVQVRPILR